MNSAAPMPYALLELAAARFRLLGEPMRLRLIDHLRRTGEASVGELAAALGTSQQNVSKHLATLHQAGVLGRRKSGNRACYSVADPSVLELCDVVCGRIAERHEQLGEAISGWEPE